MARFNGFILIGILFCGLAITSRAAVLQVSDGASQDSFGTFGSLSGTVGLIGAIGDDDDRGSAYVFRALDTATGTITQSAKLTASDGAADDAFGFVSADGSMGLVGARSKSSFRGGAYLFRSLDTATGSVTENARLSASDGASGDYFGSRVRISGNSGLVSAFGDDSNTGSVYLFRNLDTITGSVTQSAKLTASDRAPSDIFFAASLAGNTALVGAWGNSGRRGAAYLFRNLDTASGTITEIAKLTASDGQGGDEFGTEVSLSANNALVAAVGDDEFSGSTYLFRNLDTATGSVTESVKLISSDRAPNTDFASSVSLSGNAALVGAIHNSDSLGAVYLYTDLDAATGTITENVRLTPTIGGTVRNLFGSSVSLDGDGFLIGAGEGNGAAQLSGTAYSGSVSSLTKLDVGNASRSISGISFSSRDNWIIGDTTDANQVTLGILDTAKVVLAGKAVFIGRNAGSDRNSLRIDGTLNTTVVSIGAVAGNTGNVLQLEDTATFAASAFRLAPDNLLKIEGNFTAINTLLTYLGSTSLQVWDGGVWRSVDNSNHANLIVSSFNAGYTEIASVLRSQPGPLPTLTIIPAAVGTATLAWLPASPGFVLQENSTLDAATWQNSASGAQNPVTGPAGPGNRFFRLRRP